MTEPVTPGPLTSPARQAVLLAVVVVASLVLILGLSGVVGRTPAAGPSAAPSAAVAPSATVAQSAAAAPSGSGGASRPSAVPPSGSGDPVLVGAGDIGDCGTNADEATATLLTDTAGTIFTAGDNAYESGTAKEFRDCFDPTWGRFKDRIRPVPGNHDWAMGNLDGYLGYFGQAATGTGGRTWYAYTLGTWRIIALDSMCDLAGGCGPSSPQGQWLAAELAVNEARCTLAIWHHPRFSSGFHSNDSQVDPFWRAMFAAGVDVIVNGHDHDYERFAPQDPEGRADPARGIREFVVGTGGTGLRPFEGQKANSEVRTADVHGVLQLTLRDGTYDWSFITTETDVRDSGTGSCH